MSETPDIPGSRVEPLRQALALLRDARKVLLTTHVNADGDGAGSEAALAAWLAAHGATVCIANPTRFPDAYRYLVAGSVELCDGPVAWGAAAAAAELAVVLDTSEPRRIGRLGPLLEGRRLLVIDHHPPGDATLPAEVAVLDSAACATGELIHDLLRLSGEEDWPELVPRALYAAIVTDTGSFRFANTTPRTHAIAADLLRRGVDPEAEYRRLFGRVPRSRVELLRAALATLEVDASLPIAWMTLPRSIMEAHEASSEDLEGLIEHARSLEDTEVALLFREVDGGTKVSLRSNGMVDVNAIARLFGGGGHVKASGILMGGGLAETRALVLEQTRRAVDRLLHGEGQVRDAAGAT